MIETNLNMFDTIVIAIMLISCLLAFFRGLVKEILSLIGWIGAAVVTVYYFKPAMEAVSGHFKNEAIAAGATAIGLYIGALVGFSLINWLILKAIKQGGEAGMLDNLLGFGFGALRGAFIVSLGFFLMTVMLPSEETPKWLETSITRPYVEKGAAMLANAAPEYLRDISSLKNKASDYAEKYGNTNPPAWQNQQDDSESNTDSEYNEIIEDSRPAR